MLDPLNWLFPRNRVTIAKPLLTVWPSCQQPGETGPELDANGCYGGLPKCSNNRLSNALISGNYPLRLSEPHLFVDESRSLTSSSALRYFRYLEDCRIAVDGRQIFVTIPSSIAIVAAWQKPYAIEASPECQDLKRPKATIGGFSYMAEGARFHQTPPARSSPGNV